MYSTAIIILLNLFYASAQFKRICYFAASATHKNEYSFYPEDIDTSLCTHIIYAYAKIENNLIVNSNSDDLKTENDGPGYYTRIINLKKKNPDLKILIAIGGKNVGSWPFEEIIKTEDTTQLFAKNAVTFLKKWGFDGLSVDWHYPRLKKSEYSMLLETIRLAFEMDAIQTGSDKLILSATVSPDQATIDTSYEINRLNVLLDIVNLAAYEFHSQSENETAYQSGLYSKSTEMDWEKILNVDWAVNYWIKNGMSREKLILGLTFYGLGFQLLNSSITQIGAPSKGLSTIGETPGFPTYYEICKVISNNEANVSWDDETKMPSIRFDNNWISYENVMSLKAKVEYAIYNCLEGVMIWTLDSDDFKGEYCNNGPYPLLNAVVKTSLNYTNSSCPSSRNIDSTSILDASNTTSSTLTTTSVQIDTTQPIETTLAILNVETTTNPPNDISCNNQTELEMDMDDCTSFYLCIEGFSTPVAKLKCPESTWFDIAIGTCTFKMPHRCKTLVIPTGEIEVIHTTSKNTETFVTAISSTATTTPTLTTTTITTADTKLFIKEATVSEVTTSKSFNPSDSVSKSEWKCPKSYGFFAHESDCHAFMGCSNNIATVQQCPNNLVFNAKLQVCDYKSPQCPEFDYFNKSKKLQRDTTFICPEANGLFKNQEDCNTFWSCENYAPILLTCPKPLRFDSKGKQCDYKSDCSPLLQVVKRRLRRKI